MNKLILIICVAIFGIANAAIAQSSPAASPTVSATPAGQKYTCPMHPEVVQDKPGKCPKCGMNLAPEKEDDKKK
jgi:hypothetical protein